MTPKHILIVENDTSTRKLLDVLLRRAGHTTTAVASGADAITAFESRTFDLAIVDLMMPNVTGQEVILHIAKNAPSTPVIVCTAAGPSMTDPLLSPTVRAVIRKPFNIVEVTEAVDEHARAFVEPPMTVMIVDDDESARYIMRTMIDPARVVEAENAEAALHAIAEQHPDAILLDLALPGMPGEEFLRTLKSNPATREIPIVLVTARKIESDASHPLLRQADGYIYKGDLSRETVRTVLQVVLKSRTT